MQLALTVIGLPGRNRIEVVLTVDTATTVGAIAAALVETAASADRPAGTGRVRDDSRDSVVVPMRSRAISGDVPLPVVTAGPPQLWAHGGALDGSLPAVTVLHDGMVVTLDRTYASGTSLVEPSGAVELRVVGGPLAGSVHRLGLGTTLLGCGDAGVSLSGLPPRAAEVTVSPAGVRVRPLPGVPARLGDAHIDADTLWPPALPLRIGTHVLTVEAPVAPDAALSALADGGLAYNRPPRMLPPSRKHRLEVPVPPAKPERPRLPLLAALLPAVMGLLIAMLTKQFMFLLMVLLSPIMVLGNYFSEKRLNKKRAATDTMSYADQKAAYEVELAVAAAAEAKERREVAPDAAEVLLTATGPRHRLWERRYDDSDALSLRLGLADVPAAIELVLASTAPIGTAAPEPPLLTAVPVNLPLRHLGVIGLAGPRAADQALARWLVAQAAVLHSPRDLAIVVLAPDPASGADWGWLRWLPHCKSEAGASVGSDAATAAKRVTELANEVANRRRNASPNTLTVSDAPVQQTILVVLDGARELRRLPGMPMVLAEGPAVGVFAICIDTDVRLLPEECRAVVSWSHEKPEHLDVSAPGVELFGAVLADQVSTAWCDRVARALAPIRDISREDAEGGVPDSARLLEVLALVDPTPRAIVDGWRAGGRTTVATIGLSAEGKFALDLRFDGPHGLIAGTTGAGKSELLQTIIASLAIANRPDEMTFVLIDYKGGSAFKDCARLPHTVGMVSDLDPHLTQRALSSLSAELKRREELLLEADAKDIEDYCAAADAGADLDPLPRLTLVIDEFASLAKELPEFVTGLVGIAQRGRSLGVHLLLATQRPAGVVSADIRANTNLRIALRVTDASESSDVIDAPDAGRISRTTPGRCYVRSGSSSLVSVQAARVGGRRTAAAVAGGTRAVWPVVLDWAALGYPVPAAPVAEEDDGMETDLTVLVDAVRGAAEELGIATQRSPWLPPLPDLLTLDELADSAELTFGLQDVPAKQSRSPLSLDLENGGHLLIAGSPRSGRTATLRTIAGAIAKSCSPQDVHLYAVDCGGNGLLPLVAMPHCGAVVSRDQLDRLERLITRLSAEVSRRQQLLATSTQASSAEQRRHAAPEDRLPWMVLMLDRWEGYVAAFDGYDNGRLIDAMLALLREGPAVGLRAVMTSDRSGLFGQVSTVIDERIVLRLSDTADYGMAGIPTREVPASMPPGRALVPSSAGTFEAQIALLTEDPSGAAQVAALQALIGKAAATPALVAAFQRPMRVDALPASVSESEADALPPAGGAPGPLWVRVGVGGDELASVGIDLLADGPGFTIAGPPRSGRSTALGGMVRSLLAREVPVVLVTPRRSPLRSLAPLPGVLGVLGSEDTAEALAALTEGLERYVIAVDDAELLTDTPLSIGLEEVVRSARDGDHGVLVAGASDALSSTYRGFTVDVRRSRSGLILSPQTPADGDVLGVRLPRGVEGGPPGRGILVVGGTMSPVQVPRPGE